MKMSEAKQASLREEFKTWLIKEECYCEEEVSVLLDKEWDGAYPEELLGDDIHTDIGNFLYWMALFAVKKVYGEEYWRDSRFWIRIVPDPSYEDHSYVFILDEINKRILAVGCGCKTWHHDPETIEEDLKDLVEQLEKSRLFCPVCGKMAKVEYICPEHGQVG